MPILQSRLSAAIREANDAGRLGLIVYLIPGYPDREGYRRLRDLVESREEVSIIETAVPVSGGFETASPPIIRAHALAQQSHAQNPCPAASLATTKPNFSVLYKETYETMQMAGYLDKYAAVIDGLVPEFVDDAYSATHARDCQDAGVEPVTVVEPEMTPAEMDEELSYGLDDGMVYLACAPQTAGQMATGEAISVCARDVRRRRPNATIAAGMGIRGPEEIAVLAGIGGVDAAVVGTTFLEYAAKGSLAVAAYLDSLLGALARSRKTTA